MIRDAQARRDIEQQWAVVRKFCSGSHRQWQMPGGPFINETPPESFYNLPFLLAYAVLDQVLTELIDQGTIQCSKKRPLLGDRMLASAKSLPWNDYALVNKGRNARNLLAHEGALLSRTDCLNFIEGIEGELKSWTIL